MATKRTPEEVPAHLSAAARSQVVPIDTLDLLPDNPRRGDIPRVKASLVKFGQRYPIVVREGKVIAGNHRLMAMRELGWTHVAIVHADDLTDEEARAFSLADNRTSDVATYDYDLLAEQLDQLDADLRDAAGWMIDDLADLDAQLSEFEQEGSPPDTDPLYSRKIEAPIYEPRDTPPAVRDCYDTSVADRLRSQIKATTEDISPELRTFLLAAAERHTVFQFDKIADLYAHATPAVQQLMEQSALVIIDMDRAIEFGFVTLTQALAQQYDLDQSAGS